MIKLIQITANKIIPCGLDFDIQLFNNYQITITTAMLRVKLCRRNNIVQVIEEYMISLVLITRRALTYMYIKRFTQFFL